MARTAPSSGLRTVNRPGYDVRTLPGATVAGLPQVLALVRAEPFRLVAGAIQPAAVGGDGLEDRLAQLNGNLALELGVGPPRLAVGPAQRLVAIAPADQADDCIMKHHAYQWAAYRGDERLEIGPSKRDLYRKYLGKGLRRDELIVLGIGPQLADQLDGEELDVR